MRSENQLPDSPKSATTRVRVHFVTVEPGRISSHGVVLSDAEMRTLRAIAERMKHAEAVTC